MRWLVTFRTYFLLSLLYNMFVDVSKLDFIPQDADDIILFANFGYGRSRKFSVDRDVSNEEIIDNISNVDDVINNIEEMSSDEGDVEDQSSANESDAVDQSSTDKNSGISQSSDLDIGDMVQTLINKTDHAINHLHHLRNEEMVEMYQIIDDKFEEQNRKIGDMVAHVDEVVSEPDIIWSKSGYEIGKRGEDYVKNILGKKYRLTKQGHHAGDFLLEEIELHENSPLGPILIEVKNKGKANSEDIDKFHRDLIDNSSIKAGLFISLRDGIPKFDQQVTYKTICDGTRSTHCIYLCSDNADLMNICVEMLFYQMRTGRPIDYSVRNKVSKIHKLSDQLANISTTICSIRDDMTNNLTRLYESVSTLRYDIDKTIDKIYDHLDTESGESRGKKDSVFDELFSKISTSCFSGKSTYRREFIGIVSILLPDEFTFKRVGSDGVQFDGIIDFSIVFKKKKIIVTFHQKYIASLIWPEYGNVITTKGLNVTIGMSFPATQTSKHIVKLQNTKKLFNDIVLVRLLKD